MRLNNTDVIKIFAKNFILKGFRKRFIHESLRQPQKLGYRICHGIDELFDSVLINGNYPAASSDMCLNYSCGRDNHWQWMTWEEALSHRFDGTLIIDASGNAFYADTEGNKGIKSKQYGALKPSISFDES